MMNKSNDEPAIKVTNVHKMFRIPLSGNTDLKQKIVNFRGNKKGYYEFSPLNGMSFEVKKGEFFGIVGRNGSGKSTLLKTIAGIYTPDSGGVKVNGKLVPFIELGVGFNPELTGRENVFLNGALLGFSREEMDGMYDEIVDFAELHDFMNERLKNYSSGMQVRLAFSIAIRAQGDILLLDEVLAVGDSAFQQKCFDYFGQLKENNKTVVLVTHSMSAVEKFCDKGILIDGGKIVAEGDNFEIAEKYEAIFMGDSKKKNDKENKKKQTDDVILDTNDISINSVIVSQAGKNTSTIVSGKPFEIAISYNAEEEIGPGAIGINIINSQGSLALATGTGGVHDDDYFIKKGTNVVTFRVIDNMYTNDTYRIKLAIASGDKKSAQKLLFQAGKLATLTMYGVKVRTHSLFHPRVDVEVKND